MSQVVGTELYDRHEREAAKYDEMVERLSLAKAEGALESLRGTVVWDVYQRGREAQASIESDLARSLAAQAAGRNYIIARWMQGDSGSTKSG